MPFPASADEWRVVLAPFLPPHMDFQTVAIRGLAAAAARYAHMQWQITGTEAREPDTNLYTQPLGTAVDKNGELVDKVRDFARIYYF